MLYSATVEIKRLLSDQAGSRTDGGADVKFSRLHGKHASAENDTIRQQTKSLVSQDVSEHVGEQALAQQADCRQQFVACSLANRDAEANLDFEGALEQQLSGQQDVAESLQQTTVTAVIADAAKVQDAEFLTFKKQIQEKLTEQAKEIRDLKQCTEKALEQHSKAMEQAFAKQARNIENRIAGRLSRILNDRDDLKRNEMQGKFDKQKKHRKDETRNLTKEDVAKIVTESHEALTNKFLNLERKLEKGGQLQKCELLQLRKDLGNLKKETQVQHERMMMTVDERFDELTHKFQQISKKQEEELKLVIVREVCSLKEDLQQMRQEHNAGIDKLVDLVSKGGKGTN